MDIREVDGFQPQQPNRDFFNRPLEFIIKKVGLAVICAFSASVTYITARDALEPFIERYGVEKVTGTLEKVGSGMVAIYALYLTIAYANQLFGISRQVNKGSISEDSYFSPVDISQAKKVLEREDVIAKMVTVLIKPDGNNILLKGETGTGKTSLVVELARRLQQNPTSLPAPLQKCRVFEVTVNQLEAGTMYRGTLEAKIEGVIQEIRQSPNGIFFIDEAQTLFDSYSRQAGIPNKLKKLAEKGHRIILATTGQEYSEISRYDPAFVRRFNVVDVPQLSADQVKKVLKQVKKERYEDVYRVTIADDVIDKMVDLLNHLQLKESLVSAADKILGNACSDCYYYGAQAVTFTPYIHRAIRESDIYTPISYAAPAVPAAPPVQQQQQINPLLIYWIACYLTQRRFYPF